MSSNYYAVAKGRKTGIFESWDDVKSAVIGYRGARFKKFSSKEDAMRFIDDFTESVSLPPANGLVVFCDGACANNGKLYAKAGFSSVWPDHEKYNGGWRLEGATQTNNRAEFMGVIKSFQIADMIDPTKSETLHIYTDSMFLINCVTKWMDNWKKNGFKKADGSAVLNMDLLLILDQYCSSRPYVLNHVRAHTGGSSWQCHFNDMADKMAKKAIS